MKTIKIQLPDMQSPHCQMRVHDSVSKINGTEIVNIQSGILEVQFENDSIQKEVIDTIEKIGYSISGIETISSSSNTKSLSFKTNINCSGCVSKVTPFLNQEKGIENWNVDTLSKDKLLTVILNGASENDVKNAVESAGFNIQAINS